MTNNISTYYGKNKQKNKQNKSKQEPINLFDDQNNNQKQNYLLNKNYKNNENKNNTPKREPSGNNKQLKFDFSNISPEERRRRADLEFKRNKKPKKSFLTEEQKLDQEYENRKFYDSLMQGIIYDEIEKRRKLKEQVALKKYREEDETVKRIIAEERWSFSDKSLIQQKKFHFRRKKLSLINFEDVLFKIKNIKLKNLFSRRVRNINSIKKYVYSRRHFLNIKKLFSIYSKEVNYKGSKYFSFYQLFKVLPIDKIISIKNKLNKLPNNFIIQNFNLFFLKEILNFISTRFIKKNLLNRKIINSYFLYAQNKFIKILKNRYYNILHKYRQIYIFKFFQNLKTSNVTKDINFNYFQIFPVSYFFEKNNLINEKNLFSYNIWRTNINLFKKKKLNKNLLEANLSKKDLLNYYNYKKKSYSLIYKKQKLKISDFNHRFIFIKDFLKKFENRKKMDSPYYDKNSFIANSNKNPLFDKNKNIFLKIRLINKKKRLFNILKKKYINISIRKIRKIVDTYFKKKLNFINKAKKYKNKKFFHLASLDEKAEEKLYDIRSGSNFMDLTKSEISIYLKDKRSSSSFNELKDISKYFFGKSRFFKRKKFILRKEKKRTIYGYRKLRCYRFFIRNYQYYLRFASLKERNLFIRFITTNRKIQFDYPIYRKVKFKGRNRKYTMQYRRENKLKIIYRNKFGKYLKKYYLNKRKVLNISDRNILYFLKGSKNIFLKEMKKKLNSYKKKLFILKLNREKNRFQNLLAKGLLIKNQLVKKNNISSFLKKKRKFFILFGKKDFSLVSGRKLILDNNSVYNFNNHFRNILKEEFNPSSIYNKTLLKDTKSDLPVVDNFRKEKKNRLLVLSKKLYLFKYLKRKINSRIFFNKKNILLNIKNKKYELNFNSSKRRNRRKPKIKLKLETNLDNKFKKNLLSNYKFIKFFLFKTSTLKLKKGAFKKFNRFDRKNKQKKNIKTKNFKHNAIKLKNRKFSSKNKKTIRASSKSIYKKLKKNFIRRSLLRKKIRKLRRRYSKFRKRRYFIRRIKSKPIKLDLYTPNLITNNYIDQVNSYIDNINERNSRLSFIINRFRSRNIIIQTVMYYPKLFKAKFLSHKENDYTYAYWNANFLYYKFIGFLVREGKKKKAEKIFNNSLFFIREFILNNPIFFFFQAIYNCQPLFEYMKLKKRYKTMLIPRITPYHKRLSISMRNIAKKVRNSELLRKLRKANSKKKINSSYLLYNLFVSSFLLKGKIRKEIKNNIKDAFSKKHFFRKGSNSSSNRNFKYSRLLKFLSFKKMRGYHF